jgi:Nucleotidyltransferase domain
MTAPPLTPSQALRRPRARKRAGGADHLDPGTRLLLLQLEEQLAKLFGPRLRGLILFGSRARGDHGEDSDADVAVILAGPVENRFSLKSAIIDETYELFLESGILIQPWPIEEGWLDDPEEAPAPHIVRAILREGIAM